MRWVSGLTGRQRLWILLPWLAPWVVLNVLWLSWLEFHFYSPWLNKLFGLTQLLPIGALISLGLRERKFRKPARVPERCPTCGYDLRATPERCPECGTQFNTQA